MKSFVLFLLAFLLTTSLTAQIVLTNANIPAAGDAYLFAVDTTVTGLDVGTAGASAQTWDFTSLETQDTFSVVYLDPADDPNSDLFPDADLVLVRQGVSSFAQVSDTAVFLLGGGLDDEVDIDISEFGLVALESNPPQQLFTFPSTYGTGFETTYGIDVTVNAGALGFPGVDSLRLVRNARDSVRIDAYGTVQLPAGNFAALRQHIWRYVEDSLYIQFFGQWAPFESAFDTLEKFQWLAAESKGVLVDIDLNAETRLPEIAEFFVSRLSTALRPESAEQVGIKVFPNPAAEELRFMLPDELADETFQLEIFNAGGQLVGRSLVNDQQPISIRHLPVGVYSYRLHNDQRRKTISGRLVISR